jgi:glycosyltransferase involved in cell wall biosynthesis
MVYCPRSHPYRDNKYRGINLVYKNLPSGFFGAASSLFYDYYCLKHAVKQGFDIILECGYTFAPLLIFFKKSHRKKIIVHTDGLEWQRSKWNPIAKKYIRLSEKKVVQRISNLISDNTEIQKYYRDNYQVETQLLNYGATIYTPDESVMLRYKLGRDYYLTVARLEPENQVEEIIEAFLQTGNDKLVIVGNTQTKYGRKLAKKYINEKRLQWITGLYDEEVLYSVRYFSKACIHGHSAGGTNPALLEAMAAGCPVMAHDNVFNRSVGEADIDYFKDQEQLIELLNKGRLEQDINRRIKRLKVEFNWDKIAEDYIQLFGYVTQGIHREV